MTPGLWSVLIQAVGSAATLGAAAFVAWRFGLPAQGEFGLLRSWSDALAAIAAVGLPQGLLHLQYREAVPPAALRGFIRRWVMLLAALALLAIAVIQWLDLSPVAAAYRDRVCVVVAAVPFTVGHLLWRALVLKARGVVRYSVVTGLPSLLVFAGVAGLGAVGEAHGFEWVLLVAAALGAVASSAWSWTASDGSPASLPRTVLWSVSLQTWVQAALTALMTALLLSLARGLGAPLGEVGVVSLGLYVYQLFAVLAAYAAPVIYDRVAGAAPAGGPWGGLRWSRRRVAWVVATTLVGALLLPRAAAFVWATAALHVGSMTFFAVAGLAALGSRLGATLLQAQGRVRELSIQAAWRLAGALGLSALGMQVATASHAVPIALLVVELATVVRLARLLRRDATLDRHPAAEGAA
jgi:hypothetical protein